MNFEKFAEFKALWLAHDYYETVDKTIRNSFKEYVRETKDKTHLFSISLFGKPDKKDFNEKIFLELNEPYIQHNFKINKSKDECLWILFVTEQNLKDKEFLQIILKNIHLNYNMILIYRELEILTVFPTEQTEQL